MKKIISLLLILISFSLPLADSTQKAADYIDGGIDVTISIIGFSQKPKTIFINCVSMLFIINSVAHFTKAIFLD